LGRVPAPGGGGPGGSGGVGGAADVLDGQIGVYAVVHSGGGGGGVGRIRFHTKDGMVTVNGTAVLSPGFQDNPTTCTKGVAALQ
jgi:hypothetical protein